MKRFALAMAACFVLLCGSTGIAAERSRLAPADQYFGRLKMSILGIRNSLKDLSARADLAISGDAEHIYDKLVLVDDALHDWQTKYPRDPWIPKYAYSLAQLYKKLPVDDARLRMQRTFDWLAAAYPASEYAQLPR